jgi:phosphosulfolactate synthase (CoM biosynthesis protein A)
LTCPAGIGTIRLIGTVVVTEIEMEIEMNLADKYAILKADADRANEALDACKAEIKKLGCETLEGTHVLVTLSLSERKSFDAKAAQAYLTKEQVAACTKVSQVETIRIKPRIVIEA